MPRWPKRETSREELKYILRKEKEDHWSRIEIGEILRSNAKKRTPVYTIELASKRPRTMTGGDTEPASTSGPGVNLILNNLLNSTTAPMTSIPSEAMERLRTEVPGPYTPGRWPKKKDGEVHDPISDSEIVVQPARPPSPPVRESRKKKRPVRIPDGLQQREEELTLDESTMEPTIKEEQVEASPIDDVPSGEEALPSLSCTEKPTNEELEGGEPIATDLTAKGGAIPRNQPTSPITNKLPVQEDPLTTDQPKAAPSSFKQPQQTVNSNAVLVSNTAQNVWLVHPIVTFPLQHLTRQGSYAELEKALKLGGLIIDIRDEANKTATMWAIELQRHMALDLLLREGADVNQQNALGDTLMHTCAKKGDYLGLSILKRYRPNFYKTNILGEVPMFSAMQSRDPEVTQRVWEYSEDIPFILNHRAKGGYGLMHYCAVYGDTTMIRRICRHAKDAYQIVPMAESLTTPLHVAATKNNFACVETLIGSWPAQTRMMDSKGRVPIHYATNIEALAAFESYNCHELTLTNIKDGCSLAHYAAERGNAAVLAYLTRKISNIVNLKNLKGKTWLEIASPDTRARVNAILLKQLSECCG